MLLHLTHSGASRRITVFPEPTAVEVGQVVASLDVVYRLKKRKGKEIKRKKNYNDDIGMILGYTVSLN